MENKDWISIVKQLPDLDHNNGNCSGYVLAYFDWKGEHPEVSGDPMQIAYYTKDGWCFYWGDKMDSEIIKRLTHWMPLPKPPSTNL